MNKNISAYLTFASRTYDTYDHWCVYVALSICGFPIDPKNWWLSY